MTTNWYRYCAGLIMLQTLRTFLLILAFAMYISSYAQNKMYHYDLTHPDVINISTEVNEISGISYNHTDNSVFTIDDNHGELFKIALKKGHGIDRWKFGKNDDYEDIVVDHQKVFVLASNGKIVYFPLSVPIMNKGEAEVELKGKGEFESLYKDPVSERLIMLCKQCPGDWKNEVSAYAFDLKTHKFLPYPVLTLHKKDIENVLGKKINRFKPSATNVHPQTKQIYILSSINKLLVITDQQMHVQKVIKLDKKLFPQPEGLCFTPSGDMLISNEAKHKKKANILIFHAEKVAKLYDKEFKGK